MVGETFISLPSTPLRICRQMQKIFDIFPAVLRIAPPESLSDITQLPIRGDAPQGTRKLDRCRAIYAGGVLMVAVDSPEGPSLVFQEQITEHQSEGKTNWVLTQSGKIFVIEKDTNCGCGSRLRVWNPLRNIVSSTEDPT